MPCFKGLAVSIHTPSGPLPEFSVQRSTRLSRISSYIPVPPPRIPSDGSSDKPEQSTFAISITLLTPGQDVPYSAPKATSDNPYPKAQIVGGLPGQAGGRGQYTATVGPYTPLTTSPNETIAAYIYFDGRAKEEVATLLRRGEETWVNSRWVGVPESEGGGLAEREFLFREVGLERWLNGLDLEGKDAAATIERRRQKMERRRRRRKEATGNDDEGMGTSPRKNILRYGGDSESPVERVSDDDEYSGSSSSDDDDDPIPEAAGQIKVSLFRVLASGEIKRGEYSPQFDAHDDDEDSQGQKNGESGSAEVDHTTSFAKPKTLDPKTISTQTVTGIDPTDKPYATFTFLYRGERQLQKMGMLPPRSDKTPAAAKRRSVPMDFSALGPLKKEGTVGFTSFRDRAASQSQKKKSIDDMDSDSDEEAEPTLKDVDDDETTIKKENDLLSPEDVERTGQLEEGVRKIKLKRQHSAEPMNAPVEPRKTSKGTSPVADPSITSGNALSTTPPKLTSTSSAPVNANIEALENPSDHVGSPMKRQRASLPGPGTDTFHQRLEGGDAAMASALNEVLGGTDQTQPASSSDNKFGGTLNAPKIEKDDDEEL